MKLTKPASVTAIAAIGIVLEVQRVSHRHVHHSPIRIRTSRTGAGKKEAYANRGPQACVSSDGDLSSRPIDHGTHTLDSGKVHSR